MRAESGLRCEMVAACLRLAASVARLSCMDGSLWWKRVLHERILINNAAVNMDDKNLCNPIEYIFCDAILLGCFEYVFSGKFTNKYPNWQKIKNHKLL